MLFSPICFGPCPQISLLTQMQGWELGESELLCQKVGARDTDPEKTGDVPEKSVSDCSLTWLYCFKFQNCPVQPQFRDLCAALHSKNMPAVEIRLSKMQHLGSCKSAVPRYATLLASSSEVP